MNIINGINNKMSGGMPRKLIHFPPNCLRIGRRNLSAIKYMAGTIMSVIKNAKANPKMIVQLNGFQNATLSPPKKICGFNSENRVTKLILKPTAMGINARMARSEERRVGKEC